MSQSSYTPVRFVGGPKGGTDAQYAGEPKSPWVPKRGDGGHYLFEWDRDDDGVKVRSGVYTWQAGEGVPTDGDAASALIEKVGPEKAAEKLNASGSSTLVQPAHAPEDGPKDASGDKSSAELGKDGKASKGSSTTLSNNPGKTSTRSGK